MSTAQRGLVGLGVLTGLYGAWLLLSRTEELAQLVDVALWLTAGVVLHDLVLAPLVLLVAALVRRLAPGHAHAPAAVALVVLGALTVVAVPVLGRFGARADNPTLLDRPYDTSWVVLAGLTALGVAGAALVRSRRGRPSPVDAPERSVDGPGPGRR